MTDAELFPQIDHFESGLLDVGDGHRIYWEQCGNPTGMPVVFLHGGPGAGCQPVHRRFFDPDHYRIILFDQRGCGRSQPYGETRANTTAHLIADMELLRVHLGVPQWLLFGGSWGATLALAYGIAHPTRCLGFVLRGVFLGRTSDLDWFLNGVGRFFPENAANFLDFLPSQERADPLAAYRRRLADSDAGSRGAAAGAWAGYEMASSQLVPPEYTGRGGSSGAVAIARLEAHYMAHGCFLPGTADPRGYLVANVGAIIHLPAEIVQGRYDMICPPAGAWELAQAWPQARLTIMPRSGHSALEPEIRSALVQATETMKERLVPGTASAITESRPRSSAG